MYSLPAEAWLHSWMHVISILRNYCAHHSRLCFRVFPFPPKELHRARLPWIKHVHVSGGTVSQHLYFQLCAVRYLLHTCDPGNSFNEKLNELLMKYPRMDLARMGFIPGWQKEDLWKSANS
jgi:abortive infection bacteriophage resistance protein